MVLEYWGLTQCVSVPKGFFYKFRGAHPFWGALYPDSHRYIAYPNIKQDARTPPNGITRVNTKKINYELARNSSLEVPPRNMEIQK